MDLGTDGDEPDENIEEMAMVINVGEEPAGGRKGSESLDSLLESDHED